MADTPDTDKLVKKEPEGPAPDPIASRSTSFIVLISALLLMAVLGWALYDEVYGQRSWKGYQQEFVTRYNRYLRRLKRDKARNVEAGTEKEVKARPEYQELVAAVGAARAEVEPRTKEIDREVRFIERQLGAITDPFQDKRGRMTVISYGVETADEDDKDDLRKDVEELKNDPVEVEMPVSPDSDKTQEQKLNYAQLEERFTTLKDQKARLLVEKAELLKPTDEAAKRRDAFLKENVIGLSEAQIDLLIAANNKFNYAIKQININGDQIVDRCETCHLGTRESFELTPANFKLPRKRIDPLARAFVSHPTKELLTIHTPEKFGCSSCHWGNGRATTSIEKGHGQHKYWSHPMFRKENMEAGCQQCHAQDRVLDFAPQLTKGKDLFQERGCVGCHRYEGFDRETDGLASARQQIKQLEEQLLKNEIDSKQSVQTAGRDDTAEEKAQELLSRATELRVRNSQIEARIEQLNVQARYLMQDQKKVGPNLKDVRLKLRRDWIPEWLRDPQAFRPGTKMPTFWYLNPEYRSEDHGFIKADDKQRADYERRAIAAYLWQNSFEGQLPKREPGDGGKGEELFKSVGCMACHSVGDGANKQGGTFAANLQRVGEKANFDYITRWIYNPRERWAPYCPTEKRDLTREDYEKNGKPFAFDTHGNSKCPNDGAELQVQNMTVMPNFRLSEQDARDIATYLFSLGGQSSWPDASYMDSDQKLAADGLTAIKQYGCAGCHEIKGFEDEQRIGKELTTEGSTPIERLDFAMLTHDAEKNIDPFTEKKVENSKRESWYDRKGFFEYKVREPGIYDKGKEKDWRDHLRMPKPYIDMGEDGKNREELDALATFLLGSVGVEGSNVPASFFYNPADRRKDIRDGWWVVKKYNCMGCHTVQVGQESVLELLDPYKTPEGREQLPPALTTEGARVDPDWLLKFLTDPSLSGVSEEQANAIRNMAGRAAGGGAGAGASSGASPHGQTTTAPPQPQDGAAQQQSQAQGTPQGREGATGTNRVEQGPDMAPQPGANRNGVRTYLRARMPTFSFSPNELRTLVRFFQAVSSQQEPYIKPTPEPLSPQEMNIARAIFTSNQAPCLKCHLTSPNEAGKSAPNFLQAGERLQPGWTFRWLLDPQRIIPGTAMPSELFKRDGERWVFAFDIPGLAEYKGDHADLLVRYMLQLTPQEQARIASGSPAAAPAAAPAATGGGTATTAAPAATGGSHHAPRAKAAARGKRRRTASSRVRTTPRGRSASRAAATNRAGRRRLAGAPVVVSVWADTH